MKPKPTILIIEDDPLNRKLVAELLTLKGYDVLEARNGAEGVETAFEKRPELILMDIQMPVMDGFDVLQILKADPRTQGTALWVLTSFAMPGDELNIRSKGCDAYFTKPLNLRELLVRIEQHFEDSHPLPGTSDGHPEKDLP